MDDMAESLQLVRKVFDFAGVDDGRELTFTKEQLRDERDPNFDAYQDFQSQNDYSTAQLNLVGFKGDVLRAQFRPDKISERKASMAVTVANTREQQEAIATANTHGAKVFVTGGEHVTSNDMFIAAEINRRKTEATEREKEKESRVEYHARRKAALPIVDRLEHELDNNVGRLTSKELEGLLRWKGVAMSKMGNVANRLLLYQQFAEGDVVEETSIPASWTDIDKAELIALRDAPIEMYDTAYGRFEEQKKRDVEHAYQKISAAEKEMFKKKMVEIDEADAGVDEESPPPTPTPVSITSNSHFLSHFSSFLCIFIEICSHLSHRGINSRNVSILSRSKMVPVLAT